MDSGTESRLLRYSISCTDVPEPLLNKVIAKQHFGQFGKVAAMYLHPQQMSCTVDYVDKESAEEAIEYGGEYDGVLFDVDWAPNKKKQTKVVDPDWLPDPEIQAELDALGALVPHIPRLPRQQPMLIDLTGPDTFTKKLAKKQLSKPKKSSVKTPVNFENLKEALVTPALTAEQRYRVLDARDQLIRLQTSQESNVKADHIKGVCPDMCPEKERLMRESQHQIAQYEQCANDPRQMNHSIALKQYSRSSADQETPLPHELRPVPVLERTMAYLLQKIVGLSEEENVNLNDWFHFVWDRMRSIRKDITQQELCCKGSVNLVEQCARFHIHCAARLVGEDASVFDHRINTENLTKCLQSLKYMYDDLAKKKETCANEAEFRAYIILLNLNDCNFMWEVQRWSTSIQNSSHVKFAIKVFLALDSNNYVKFFKLVRETSYMNACILLRYFNQVRSRAIGTIMKSYIARLPMHFPLADLTNILAFENICQCARFMEHYGLICNDEVTTVHLDKMMFMEPEYPSHLMRCFNLIESKRTCSVGEAIFGRKMVPIDFTKYVAHCSFDNEGYLTTRAMNAEDQHYLSVKIEENISLSPGSMPFTSRIFKKIDPAPDVQKPIEYKRVDTLDNNKHESNITGNVFGSTNNLFSKMQTNVVKDAIDNSNIFSKPSSANIFSKTPVNQDLFSFTNQAKPDNIFGGPGSNVNVFNIPKVDVTKFGARSSIFTRLSSPSNAFTSKGDPVENKSDNEVKSIFSFSSESPLSNRFPSGNHQSNSSSSPTLSEKSSTSSEGSFTMNIPSHKLMKPIESYTSKEEEMAQDKQKKKDLQDQIEKSQKRKELEEQKRQEIIKKCEEQASVLSGEILEKEILKTCRILMEHELQKCMNAANNAAMATDNFISHIVEEICHEEMRSELYIHRQLEFMKARIETRLAIKYFEIWIENVLIKKLKRKATEETPAWLSKRSLEEEASQLYRSNQELALENILNYKESCSNVLSLVTEPIKKIDIFEIVYENIITSSQHSRPKSKAYWKMIISLPDEIESSYWAKYFDNWIDSAFRDTQDLNDKNQLILNEYMDTRQSASLALSFRKIIGCRNSPEDMCGANGLIFLGTNFSVSRMKDRLIELLKYREKPKISLVIVNLKIRKDGCDDVVLALDMSLLVDAGLVGAYKIICSEDHTVHDLYRLTTEAMEWLSLRFEPDPPLEMDNMETFICKCLGSELIHRFSVAASYNYILKKSFTTPNFIIELYNDAVTKCLEMLSQESSFTYKDFAPEMKQFLPKLSHMALSYEYFPVNWKDVKQVCRVKSIIKNFEMPFFDGLEDVNDFTSLKKLLSDYCIGIICRDNCEKVISRVLCKALRNINQDEYCYVQVSNLPWIEMMDILVQESVIERLNRILSKTPNLYVIYNKQDFSQYLNNPWWLKSKQFMLKVRTMDNNFMTLQEGEMPGNKRQKLNNSISASDEFNDSISRAVKTLESFDKNASKAHTMMKADFEYKCDQLNSTVSQYAIKMNAFNKIVDNALKNFP